MKEFVELLKKKGIADKIQSEINGIYIPDKMGEEKGRIIDGIVIGKICKVMDKDSELKNKFFENAMDLVIDELDMVQGDIDEKAVIKEQIKKILEAAGR